MIPSEHGGVVCRLGDLNSFFALHEGAVCLSGVLNSFVALGGQCLNIFVALLEQCQESPDLIEKVAPNLESDVSKQ